MPNFPFLNPDCKKSFWIALRPISLIAAPNFLTRCTQFGDMLHPIFSGIAPNFGGVAPNFFRRCTQFWDMLHPIFLDIAPNFPTNLFTEGSSGRCYRHLFAPCRQSHSAQNIENRCAKLMFFTRRKNWVQNWAHLWKKLGAQLGAHL